MPSERPARYSHRSNLLQEAEKIITVDRNKSYGEPDEDFQRIAAIASAMGFRVLKTVERPDGDTSEFVALAGSDVARFMIALKLSRLAWNSTHRDSWLDLAGYAACGYETAQLEEGRRNSTAFAPPEKPEPDLRAEWAITPDIREAGQKAAGGDPSDLENMGYMLAITYGTDECEFDDNHHFDGRCSMSIRRRRRDA
jgi:hypothetical protein